MKKTLLTTILTASLLVSSVVATVAVSAVQAAEYKVDVKGAHAFVQFKIKHLGYSWLLIRLMADFLMMISPLMTQISI